MTRSISIIKILAHQNKIKSLIFILILVVGSFPVLAIEKPLTLDRQLKQLVEINSGTSNTSGVRKIQDWISNELKLLGFSVEVGPDNFLVGTLNGSSAKIITFIVHADTVFEPNSPFQSYTTTDDKQKASGPGVIDDKGGIIVAIEGLRRLINNGKPMFSIRFLSSPSEETGSNSIIDKYLKFAEDSWIVLGFEPALEDGSIIDSRRGDRWYHITVEGKEAHAGRAHKDGINACHALATKVSEISKLTDYKKNVTVSIGHMEGGKDKYNIVCGNAQAKIDTRFTTIRDRDKLHKDILAIINKVEFKGALTQFELADDCPPFSPLPESKTTIDKYLKIINNIENKKIKSAISGGAADSNNFSNGKNIIIDGLGPVGGKMHTAEEFIDVQSLETRSEALFQFLSQVK